MPKKLLKRFMPDPRAIREHKYLRIFGPLVHDPNLFHLNRRSASGAFAVGLFMAFVPVPFQMVLAAAGAIAFRVNLPLSVALVWLTNPVTMPPMFYSCYKVGAWLLRTPPGKFHFALSGDWLMTELSTIWQPFLLGCFVVGSISAALGYVVIRGLWRLNIIRQLERKRRIRLQRRDDSQPPQG